MNEDYSNTMYVGLIGDLPKGDDLSGWMDANLVAEMPSGKCIKGRLDKILTENFLDSGDDVTYKPVKRIESFEKGKYAHLGNERVSPVPLAVLSLTERLLDTIGNN